ncbi:MAG TPA: hypothetical protein VLK85_18100, partial [Ramlibacter sp.]|nr:hypothetical protein [Ramlibacter sp.]
MPVFTTVAGGVSTAGAIAPELAGADAVPTEPSDDACPIRTNSRQISSSLGQGGGDCGTAREAFFDRVFAFTALGGVEDVAGAGLSGGLACCSNEEEAGAGGGEVSDGAAASVAGMGAAVPAASVAAEGGRDGGFACSGELARPSGDEAMRAGGGSLRAAGRFQYQKLKAASISTVRMTSRIISAASAS